MVGEKRAIQIEEIFDELDKEGGEPIGKVLLLGGAGIGKTTLMHHISHQWAKGRLWKGKYDYLFRVRLKELLNHSWQSGCNPDDLDEHPLACFIHHCLRNQRTQLPLPRSKRKAFKLCSLEEIKSLLEDSASQPSVLLLVDGYDEIASKSQEDIIVKDIVDSILEREQVIMTSRPNAADKKLRAAFDRQVESQGLDRVGIDQYIDLQFSEGQAGQDLKDFLTNNRQILGMCEVPINTALLCIIWKDPAFREIVKEQTGEDLKLGELYQALVVWLGKRYMKKFQDRDHTTLTEEFILKHHPVVKTLKEVAYTSFTGAGKEQAAGTLGIAGEDIANAALEQPDADIDIDKVYQYGLLRAEGRGACLKDKTHYFIHLTFQEYLTALRLSEALSQGDGVREVATHLAEHRNEPRYLMTLKFLAGLVSKSSDTALVQRFWEAVSCNVEGVLELGVASKVGLLMHLMAQSTTNGKLDERIPNSEKLQKLVDEEVVKDLARWQDQLIASGYKSAALVRRLREVIYQEKPECDISALSAALEIGVALGIQVLEEEQPLAERLEDLLDSPVWQVQALAAAKLAQVLDDTVDPGQVSRLLDKLLGLYEVANTKQGALAGIRRLAELKADIVVEELRKIVSQGSAGSRIVVLELTIALAAGSSKQLAKQLLELGQAWLQSSYLEVRESALLLMGQLLSIDAGLAPDLLQAAKTGIKDAQWYVRLRALTLMDKLLSIDAGLAPDLLQAAKTGIRDAESDVRSSALTLIDKLLTIDAGLATECLEAAKKGVNDVYNDVRSSALSLIDKLLSIDAGLAPDLLEAAKTWVNDENRWRRPSALTLMEKLLAKDAGLATECLEAAMTGVKDAESDDVRSSALSLMEKLLSIDAGLATDLLEAAMTGVKDDYKEVRSNALSLMEKLLGLDAGLAPDILEAAMTGVKDEYRDVRSSALSLIDKLLAIDAGLATECLEAAMTGVMDADRDVRLRALSLIDKLLAKDAGLAPDLLEAAMTGVKDDYKEVRSNALSLMEKLLGLDAGLAPDILEAAKTGVKDDYEEVRSNALSLMEKLLAIDAALAQELLEDVQTGLKDPEGDVRHSAFGLATKLVEISPALAQELLEDVQTGLKDPEGDVRQRALGLATQLVGLFPALAQELLEAAQTGIKDQGWKVRQRALELPMKLVETDAALAQGLLEAAQIGLKDPEWSVRQSALELSTKLVETDAALAQGLLEAAQAWLKDPEWSVRSSALALIEKLLALAPALAQELLEATQRGINDFDRYVRHSALSLMEKLAEADPSLAQPLLEAAQRGITDNEESVRDGTLELMWKLVEIHAALAQGLRKSAQRGINDSDRYVRHSAFVLIDKLLAIEPALAQELLEATKIGINDEGWSVRQFAFSLMERLLAIEPALAQELLEAAQRGINDSDRYVRHSALALMKKLLAIEPALVQELLEVAQRGFKDENWEVRASALSLIDKLLAIAPFLAQELLETAQRWLTEQEGYVRSSALDLMGTLVERAPELAQPLLEAAQRGINDSDRYVRHSALSLMEKLLAIDAALAQELLEAAQRGIKDEHPWVRHSTLALIEKLLAIDAALAQELLEVAQAGINDSDYDVRYSALSLMEKLLAIDAALAPQFLEAAQRGTNDSYSVVRLHALALMEKLLAIEPALAQELLETAQTGINDSDYDVRHSALSLIEKLLAIDAALAPQFLEAAQRRINDSYSAVRLRALSLMEKFLAIAPSLAQELLEVAQTGINDSDRYVRLRALSLMEKLLAIEPALAQKLLEAAQTGINDFYEDVRQRVLSLIEKLVEADASLAQELLEAAQRGIKDKDVDVRCAAFELLRKLAAALDKPEIARDALSQLKAQLEEETWRIERSALQTALTFTKLIPSSAKHWLELVPYGLRDEESETQEAAISLGVELAFHLPAEAVIPILLTDPESPAVRDKAKEHFIKRLQDKTITYSPQDILVLDQLLQHSTADSELDQSLQSATTQKLLELAPQVAEQSGLEYLNTHFDALSVSKGITAFLKKVMHQTLADNVIDDLEAKLITKCILQHGITATIAPRQRLFVLEDSRYQLKDSSEASLQQIVNRVIEESETELARQYKAHQPLFKNTGLGLSIAASDIPTAGSVVNDADLTTNTWHLSVMHLSDHHQQAPQDTFLLLEQRNYEGEHVIKKITYAQGQYTLAYDESINPNKALDTNLRKELFGPMEYEPTKPRYYATCYTLSNEAARELLDKINQQVGPEAQDAYQALHQLARKACEADHDEAGAQQLDRKWSEYAQALEGRKKVDLLQLSQEEAVQVRQYSLTIADREENREKIEENKENIEGVKKDVESHENILEESGTKDEAAINKKLKDLKASDPKLYDYCHTFIWTLSRYIAASGIASTGMFSQELDRSTKEAVGMGLVQAGMAGAESVPVFGDFAGLLGKLIDAAYEGVKTAKQENKIAVINKIIQDNHRSPKDMELTIRRAGLLIAERQKEKILSPPEKKSTLEKLLGIQIEDFKHTIEHLKHTMLRTYELPQSPQAGLAIEDVLLLLVRMYKEHKTLNQPGGELYEQLAALVCTGSLPDLVSQSTAATQEDEAIPQAESALKAPIISPVATQEGAAIAQAESALKAPAINPAVTQEDAAIAQAASALKAPAISPGVTREDLAQAERALAERTQKKGTVDKLKKKAGEGSWEATRMKRGKECEEFFEEACVRGYIADSQPGVAVSDKQIEAMRMVLFRYMCEGIQESEKQSLACAEGFAAKYPALVEKLAKEYPTYFVTKAIAKACITDPSLASEVMSRLSS